MNIFDNIIIELINKDIIENIKNDKIEDASVLMLKIYNILKRSWEGN